MKNSILILIFLCSVSVFAQNNVNLNYSSTQITDVKRIHSSLLYSGAIYLLKSDDSNQYYIEAYDANSLILLNTSVFSDKEGNSENSIARMFTPVSFTNLNGKLFLVLTAIDKRNNMQLVGLQQIDNTGKPTGELKQIGAFSQTHPDQEMRLSVVTSENLEFCAISLIPELAKDAQFYLYTIIYNGNTGAFKLNTLDTEFEFQWTKPGGLFVSNQGQAFISIKEEKNTNWRPSLLEEKSWNLYVSDNASNSFKTFNLLSEKYDIDRLWFTMDEQKNRFECWGLYGNINNKYGARDYDGLLKIRIDPENFSIIERITQPLSKEIIARVNEVKAKKLAKDEGLSKNFTMLKKVSLQGDDWLILEQINQSTTNSYAPGLNVYSEIERLKFGQILSLNIDEELKVQNQAIIPKMQETMKDNINACSAIIKEEDDKILLFFNDFIKNTEAEPVPMAEVKGMSEPDEAGFFKVEISADGAWTKKLVKYNLDDKKIIIPMSQLAKEEGVHIGLFTTRDVSGYEDKLNLGIYRLQY